MRFRTCSRSLLAAGAFALTVLTLVFSGHGCGGSPPRTYLFQGPAMGATFTVKVVADALNPQREFEIRQAISAELEAVNAKMSTYVESSELSQFNHFSQTVPFRVSSETFEVFAAAQRISAASGGAFDITVGPLVDAWGFGPPERSPEEPTEALLKQLREHVGWQKIELDEEASTIRKLDPAIACDLSAIAKGYAVDHVSETLAGLGHVQHMVEVGGEVRVLGRNAAGERWRIGVERPTEGARAVERIVPLDDLAMATSGDYRNYYEKDGMRISHTIDPRSGRPVRHQLASVTVVDRQCMLADGYATALMVLGEEEGYRLAERENLAALFLVREGDGFRSKETPRFADLLSGNAPSTAYSKQPVEARLRAEPPISLRSNLRGSH